MKHIFPHGLNTYAGRIFIILMAYASHNDGMAFIKAVMQLLITLTVKNGNVTTILISYGTQNQKCPRLILQISTSSMSLRNMQNTQKTRMKENRPELSPSFCEPLL